MPATPPSAPVRTSPHAHGTIRVAAMAASHARQARQRIAQRERIPGSILASNVRAPSPVNSFDAASGTTNTQFHVKKNLHLQLNMDTVKKPELPLMVTTQMTTDTVITIGDPIAAMTPRQRVQFVDSGDVNQAAPMSDMRRRRASSVTLGMNSPEGAEFQEVAHDGPVELGKRTKRVKKLGKGAGGAVYMSIYLPELKLVAVKEVVVYKEEERHMVQHELHALHENLAPIESSNETASPRKTGGGFFGSSSTSDSNAVSSNLCPYQVSFYGAYLTPAKCAVSIVMEFMDMGSLQDLVDAKVSIPEPVVRHGAFCCLTALEHMHSQRMIHRDIKPANILLNRKGDFKVADFGLADTLSKSASYFSEFEGTMMYMAPERISGKNYTYVSDIWSLGLVLFSLATGGYPFAVDDGFFGLEEAICTDPLPPMPNRFSPECRDFLKGLIRRDPESRLTSTQALSHPFLRGYQGSAAHRDFETLWQRMPLRPAIKPEDASKIVQVVADHSRRHPIDHFLPQSLTTRAPMSPSTASSSPSDARLSKSPIKNKFFSQITDFFGGGGSRKHDDGQQVNHMSQLADECGVTPDYLNRLLQQELVNQ